MQKLMSSRGRLFNGAPVGIHRPSRIALQRRHLGFAEEQKAPKVERKDLREAPQLLERAAGAAIERPATATTRQQPE